MMNSTEQNHDAEKGIGDTNIGESDVTRELTSDEQKVLKEMHGVVGNAQVTRSKL